MVNQVNREKLGAVISYFADHSQVPDLGMVKLWKLIYFADVEMAREHGGESITGSEYIKYKHGPVPSSGTKVIKVLARNKVVNATPRNHFGYQMMEVLPGECPGSTNVLSADELAALAKVAQRMGTLTAKEIEEQSHCEPAWLLAQDMQKLDAGLMLYGAKEDPEGL